MAARCGFPCLYVSTEMQLMELLRRTTARETETYLGKLKTGELGPRESVRLAAAAATKCGDLAFLDGLTTTVTVDQMADYANAMRVAADTRRWAIRGRRGARQGAIQPGPFKRKRGDLWTNEFLCT
jgi:hypothetical protein